MNVFTMLDKKMTLPEQQQQGSGANPNDPTMADPTAGTPQDDMTDDQTQDLPTLDQSMQSQDDRSSDDSNQADDTDALSAYPPVPPEVPPQDEKDMQDTQSPGGDVSQPTVVDTQNVDEGMTPPSESKDKPMPDANMQPLDKSQLPVGEQSPSQDISAGTTEESGVDQTVKDMAKPVEPPSMDEKQTTSEPGKESQMENKAVNLGDTSQMPQGEPSEQSQPSQTGMQSQTPPMDSSNDSDTGDVSSSQPNTDQPAQSFQVPPASHTVGPTDQGQAQPIPPSPGGDSVPVAPLSQTQDDNTEEQTLKKAHEPVFILPDDYHAAMTIPIHVRVSSVLHPMDEDHYIQSIELFANGTSVGKVELQPKENEVAEAEFQVNVQKGMVLRAVATCNRHGDWASEKTV